MQETCRRIACRLENSGKSLNRRQTTSSPRGPLCTKQLIFPLDKILFSFQFFNQKIPENTYSGSSMRILKARYNAGETSNLYYWRDRSGHEVDLLIDHGSHLSPLEIKSGQTINKGYFKGLEFWQKLAGKTAGKAWLVYGGDSRQMRSDVTVLPWHEINSERIVMTV
ncbi:MAG: DUF4143 domain-containing protein [Gammaproteobacteria bacterium (ex Lamellibrachia satsuma)]|nr:MAG: DUF4143 domain-containing protein [Gammaproteobacteria bacterium (ex Lamellibrachia satsuma)]